MACTDEHYRYVEYLQRQTLDEDWKECFDAASWKTWALKNGDRLKNLVDYNNSDTALSLVAQLEQNITAFEPKTRYEVPFTASIFEPILNEVKDAAAVMGMRPIRPVEIVTSTDSAATPAARPTTSSHLLFIGLGTSSFCNYWAKAVTAATMGIAPTLGFARITDVKDIEQVFRRDPSGLILAMRLSLYYAAFGTTIAFGEVRQPSIYIPYRAQLCHAMETFAVAHEYAHFVAEERLRDFSGSLDDSGSQDLELFCDALGLQISRECGNRTDNYLSFAGIGALVFFRVIQLCESLRGDLIEYGFPLSVAKKEGDKVSHPSTERRIQEIRVRLIETTDADQRASTQDFFEEYDRILMGIISIVLETGKRTMEQDAKA